MQRALAYGRRAASDWLALASSFTCDDPALLEGRIAYAREQAAFEAAFEKKLLNIWTPVLAKAQTSPIAGPLLVTERVAAVAAAAPVVDFSGGDDDDDDDDVTADADDADDDGDDDDA
jgi:hypothetical protein